MGIDYGFKVGLGLQLDEELAQKIVDEFELDIDDDLEREVADQFYFKEFDNNPITTFSTGNFVCDYNIKHWIGINLEGFDVKLLEELLQNKDRVIKWFAEFGLDVKWEDLEFIKELKVM